MTVVCCVDDAAAGAVGTVGTAFIPVVDVLRATGSVLSALWVDVVDGIAFADAEEVVAVPCGILSPDGDFSKSKKATSSSTAAPAAMPMIHGAFFFGNNSSTVFFSSREDIQYMQKRADSSIAALQCGQFFIALTPMSPDHIHTAIR